jgi:hypothetical protein
LKVNRLRNSGYQQDSKKTESDRARETVADNRGTTSPATVRFLAPGVWTLLWFIRSKQPFKRWDRKHEQKDRISHEAYLMKRLVCDRTWQDRNPKPVNDKAPPRLTPAAGND